MLNMPLLCITIKSIFFQTSVQRIKTNCATFLVLKTILNSLIFLIDIFYEILSLFLLLITRFMSVNTPESFKN